LHDCDRIEGECNEFEAGGEAGYPGLVQGTNRLGDMA
jgi:hypothetical protein